MSRFKVFNNVFEHFLNALSLPGMVLRPSLGRMVFELFNNSLY